MVAAHNFCPENLAYATASLLRGADMLPYNDRMVADLTPRIARFVEEYLVDPNGTKAAIRAGYSAKTAAQQASRLLRNVKVQQAIATSRKQLAATRQWDLERLVKAAEINLIAARSGRNFSAANGALELIGKATGILGGKPRDPQPPAITTVTFVLDRGNDPEGGRRGVETSYRELPQLAEGEYREVEDDGHLGPWQGGASETVGVISKKEPSHAKFPK